MWQTQQLEATADTSGWSMGAQDLKRDPLRRRWIISYGPEARLRLAALSEYGGGFGLRGRGLVHIRLVKIVRRHVRRPPFLLSVLLPFPPGSSRAIVVAAQISPQSVRNCQKCCPQVHEPPAGGGSHEQS